MVINELNLLGIVILVTPSMIAWVYLNFNDGGFMNLCTLSKCCFHQKIVSYTVIPQILALSAYCHPRGDSRVIIWSKKLQFDFSALYLQMILVIFYSGDNCSIA